MPGTTIKKNAVVEYAIIGENCVVESDAMIGMNPESVPNRDDWGIAVLGHNITISSGKRVLPKEIIFSPGRAFSYKKNNSFRQNGEIYNKYFGDGLFFAA